MPKQRAVRSHTLSGLVALTFCSGCSLFISLDEITPDHPAEGGAGTTVVTDDVTVSDAPISNDVSTGVGGNAGDATAGDARMSDARTNDARTSDASAASDASDASTGGNADGGTVSMHPDAITSMPASDGGADGGACSNPLYPVPCPATDGGVAAGCWSSGIDCSSIRNCGGTAHGCPAGYVFDCTANHCALLCNPTCSCADPSFPVLCSGMGSPADGGTTTDCWSAGTDCSTVTNCNGDYHACSTGFRYDCANLRCVPV